MLLVWRRTLLVRVLELGLMCLLKANHLTSFQRILDNKISSFSFRYLCHFILTKAVVMGKILLFNFLYHYLSAGIMTLYLAVK